MSPTEKLILVMLADLHQHLKVQSDINPNLVKTAIQTGNTWALKQEYQFSIEADDVPSAVANEVSGILGMWKCIEEDCARLDQDKRGLLEAQASEHELEFRGFDGNNENAHFSAARFLIDEMDRFSYFKQRELNAHTSTLDKHTRMKAIFDKVALKRNGRPLNLAELLEIISAGRRGSED